MKERLQKVIAASHGVSRRGAEELIKAGKVIINGRVATIGESADPDHDKIEVEGHRLENRPKKTYIALHKPRGYVTTMSDEFGRRTVSELVKNLNARLFPVGRLDMDSEGLLLMTNDGEWANIVAHPSNRVEKEYLVTVEGDLKAASITMSKGMDITDENGEVEYHVDPVRVSAADIRENGGKLAITICEGHNREIRRMCEACGLKVRRLVRVAIGGISVQGIKPGTWRMLEEEEIKGLRGKRRKEGH